MKLNIKSQQSIQILEQRPGMNGVYEQIEKCGRNCYRSQVKGGTSAINFTKAMISSGHLAMVEHGTVYLKIPVKDANAAPHEIVYNPYTRANRILKIGRGGADYITTNMRVLVENDWLDMMGAYWSEPTKYHEKRLCVLFDTNIGISREFNRHRVNSMAESSTRYCNYAKEKFNGTLSVVEPMWLRDRNGVILLDNANETMTDIMGEVLTGQDKEWEKFNYWLLALKTSNYCYQKLIEMGCKPEEAREVLPLATNTQLIHTAFISDWKHFLDLRAEDTSTNHPHPMAKELASLLKQYMVQHNLLY